MNIIKCHYCIWSGARRRNLLQFFWASPLSRCCSLPWTERPQSRPSFSWSPHTFTCITTHTHFVSLVVPLLLHALQCFPLTHSYEHRYTLKCGPLSWPCLICFPINSPSLRNLSQTALIPGLSSHNGALPAHMLLSITHKCHSAGVTALDPSLLSVLYFFFLLLWWHYMSMERRSFFFVQGYSGEKTLLWQKWQSLEVSCRLTDWVC